MMDSETKTLLEVRSELVKQAAKLEQMIAFRVCPFSIGDVLVSKQPKRGMKMSNAGQRAIIRGILFSQAAPHYRPILQWLDVDGEPIQGNWAEFVFYDWEKA